MMPLQTPISKVSFASLTHRGQYTDNYPLGIAMVAAYVKQRFGKSIEVEIYKNDNGSYYYNDPESGEEVSCDEDGNELDEETVRKNLMEGISKMSRIEELNVKLDSGKITPEEIEEFKKLLEEED